MSGFHPHRPQTAVVRITSVRKRKQRWSSVFEVRVLPRDGMTDTRTFRTRNQWKAAICDQARKTGRLVQFTSLETWWGPEIEDVSFVEQERTAS